MDESKRKLVAAAFAALHDEGELTVATEGQLAEFESAFGPIPDDFRWFLKHCGGGAVGCEHVDGIHELPDSHRKFTEESAIENGWTMGGVFVIGWDGGGNPFGIETATGRVLVEDHDFGGIHEMSPSLEASLEAFLERGLLRNE